MGLGRELLNAKTGFAVVHASAKFRDLPIILSEADPEGCGACSPAQHPEDAYRNSSVYPAYTAAEMQGLTELASQEHVSLAGFLTWAFEFEGQSIFAGQRALATHGIDKPEMNFFRAAGLLGGDRVRAASSAAIPADSIVQEGVRTRPEIDAVATRAGNSAAVMLWSYADDDVASEATSVHLMAQGVPETVRRVLVEEYRIDATHSNAYTVWKQMGSPQEPSAEQMAQLRVAGQLQLIGSPRWVTITAGRMAIDLDLSPESVSLLRLTWTGDTRH